jgi:hypothetical protein
LGADSIYADANGVQQIYGGTIQSLEGIKYLFHRVYKSPTFGNPRRLHHTSIEEIRQLISLNATLKPPQASIFELIKG